MKNKNKFIVGLLAFTFAWSAQVKAAETTALPSSDTGPSSVLAAPISGVNSPLAPAIRVPLAGVSGLSSAQNVAIPPQQFHFAVIGAGDVVKNYYSPAFKELKEKYAGTTDLKVTFIDDSRYWSANPLMAEKARGIIAELKSWGAEVLDAADPQVGIPAIAALRPDATIVATPDFAHVDTINAWLDRPEVPRRIFVEKPIDRDRKKALGLLNRVGYGSDRVLVLDHYAARLLPGQDQLDLINHHLGGGIKSFAYYFLEDHSGDDPNHTAIADRDGAIEREQRQKALDGGMVLDGIPHLFPLLRYFAHLDSIRVTGVRAAQYTGVDGDPDKRAEIKGETFAEVHLAFSRKPSIYGAAVAAAEGLIEGVAYVGKGIHGVKALGPEYDRNVKMLTVVGLNGRSIKFDLRSSSPDNRHARAYLLDQQGNQVMEFPLYAKPYRVLFERILLDVTDALHIENGERILEVIERVIGPIRDQPALATYPGGLKGKRPSPFLEEVQARVPYLFYHPAQ